MENTSAESKQNDQLPELDFHPLMQVRLDLRHDAFMGRCSSCRNWNPVQHYYRKDKMWLTCTRCSSYRVNRKEEESIKCTCGVVYKKKSQVRHLQSKRHSAGMEFLITHSYMFGKSDQEQKD